jgi:hypothetical protein
MEEQPSPRRGRPRKVVVDAAPIAEGEDASSNDSSEREDGGNRASSTGKAVPYAKDWNPVGKTWFEWMDFLKDIELQEAHKVLVKARIPMRGPDFFNGRKAGYRIEEGPLALWWSDGSCDGC